MVQAPMANVTDAAWRRLFAKYGKPDVTYTEFVSADGLLRADEEGKRKLLRDLEYTEAERPIVAQFFTASPEAMEHAARIAAERGFDGIDINMGCPDRVVEKQGAGAALMKDPKRAQEIIAAAKRGAPNLPISVKTRLGYNKDELETWLPVLLEAEPAAIIVHARTRKEMSKVPARWERVARAVEIRDKMKSEALIIGNGDVANLSDARARCAETRADGAMIGRGLFGDPFFFQPSQLDGKTSGVDSFSHSQECENESRENESEVVKKIEERLRIAVEHTKLFEELLGDIKSFALMKKHFKAYVHGFPGAHELRAQLMETENAAQVEKVIEDFLHAQR